MESSDPTQTELPLGKVEPEQVEEEIEFGDVEIFAPPDNSHKVKFDRMAYSGSQLLLVSVIASTQDIKAIRALLAGNPKSVSINVGGSLPFKRGERTDYPYRLTPVMDNSGYFCNLHKVGLGHAHAMFWSKSDMFMLSLSPEAIWAELCGPKFSTPILKEWAPWLTTALRASGKLGDAWCFNCACGGITATTADLDKIVTEGLRTNAITIPGDDDEVDQQPEGEASAETEAA